MFHVKAKNNNENIVTVYGVRKHEHTHETEFLVFFMGRWCWSDADRYEPIVLIGREDTNGN